MIVLDPHTHWCNRHRKAFRPRWPKGYMPATLALLEEALRRDDVQQALGGDDAMLERVLLEYSPLCCLVGDEITARWTALALADDLLPMAAALDELRSQPEPRNSGATPEEGTETCDAS